MKSTTKKLSHRSVERQSKDKEKEKEKDFEVFLQGANQQRVQHKRIKEIDKRLPVKEMKKWKQDNIGDVEEQKNDEMSIEEEVEESALYQELGSLDKNGLDQLRKSLCLPIFSQEQKDLLKRLSEEPSKYQEKFNPHFSQINENSDVDDEELKQIDEERQEQTGHSNEEVDHIDESITEDLCNSKIKQDISKKQTQNIERPSSQRKSIPAQIYKIGSKPSKQEQYPQFQVDQKKPRPISAVISIAQQPSEDINKQAKLNQQTTKQIVKKINTNPFGNNRPQSVVQNQTPLSSLAQNLSEEDKLQDILQTTSCNDIGAKNTHLDNILFRIQRMDDQQRIQLEKLLDQLEQKQTIQKISKPYNEEQMIQENTSGAVIKQQSKTLQSNTGIQLYLSNTIDNEQSINLIILSTWGSTTMVGLTEIQLYDQDGALIKLKSQNLRLRNTQSIKPIDILINDQYMTNNASNMWLASLPELPMNIEIEIKYRNDIILAGLKIWNYNKSLIDSGKGVKNLMIIYQVGDQIIKINQVLKKGTGHDMEDYGTEIQLIEGFEFQKKSIKTQEIQVQSENLQNLPFTNNESQRVGSRRSKGPMVYNIFKEDESLVRIQTAKSTRSIKHLLFDEDNDQPTKKETESIQSQQGKFDNVDYQKIKQNNDTATQDTDTFWQIEKNFKQEGRQRGLERKDESQDELLQTIKNFDLIKPGRFQAVESSNYEYVQRQQKDDDNHTDALDMFFREQIDSKRQKLLQPSRSNLDQPNPTVNQVSDGKRIRQTESNTQLIQQIITDNQQQIQKQQSTLLRVQDKMIIPNKPIARYITIQILSTWGDKHYVGLNGIELFDDKGQLVELAQPKRQVKADPADINTLPEYDGDPRTPDKLMDGVYFSQSDMHVWLAPFTKGKINYIYIDLLEKRQISMLRIWNYNKSRIHSFRGVKEISILMDKQLVFQGIISKAPGNLSFQEAENERLFECILFTNDQQIIQNISKSDWINLKYKDNSQQDLSDSIVPRPITGSKSNSQAEGGRPTTSVKVNQFQNEIRQARQQEILEQNLQTRVITQGIKCKYLKIEFHQTWQTIDQTYLGLTGIEIYDHSGEVMKIDPSQLIAQPKDMSAIPGHTGDKRILSNVVNDQNITRNDHQMWLIPYCQGRYHYMQINFPTQINITAIKIWNYNKNQEDSYRGAKVISLHTEEGQIGNKLILKKAPGVDVYDFGQYISLPPISQFETFASRNELGKGVPSDYETLFLPQDFDLKINLVETYGDIHYIGLNGIEIYDSSGMPLVRSKNNPAMISASPDSLRNLPHMSNDPRIANNLLQEPHETYDDKYMWLSPFVNRYFENPKESFQERVNTLYISFDRPITISAISFWNYTKNPERGAKEIAISLGEHIIYKGYLRIAKNQDQFKKGDNMNQTVILFCKIPQIMEKFAGLYYNEMDKSQKVNYHNENKGGQYVHKNYGSLDRPITSASGIKK